MLDHYLEYPSNPTALSVFKRKRSQENVMDHIIDTKEALQNTAVT
jgi:hypothetical protein